MPDEISSERTKSVTGEVFRVLPILWKLRRGIELRPVVWTFEAWKERFQKLKELRYLCRKGSTQLSTWLQWSSGTRIRLEGRAFRGTITSVLHVCYAMSGTTYARRYILNTHHDGTDLRYAATSTVRDRDCAQPGSHMCIRGVKTPLSSDIFSLCPVLTSAIIMCVYSAIHEPPYDVRY
eukprot:483692-Rhodomonas_salina.1